MRAMRSAVSWTSSLCTGVGHGADEVLGLALAPARPHRGIATQISPILLVHGASSMADLVHQAHAPGLGRRRSARR
jgi:hypothetical protein